MDRTGINCSIWRFGSKMLRSNSVRMKTIEIIPEFFFFFLTKRQYVFLKYSEEVSFFKQELDSGEKGSPVDCQGASGFSQLLNKNLVKTFIFFPPRLYVVLNSVFLAQTCSPPRKTRNSALLGVSSSHSFYSSPSRCNSSSSHEIPF